MKDSCYWPKPSNHHVSYNIANFSMNIDILPDFFGQKGSPGYSIRLKHHSYHIGDIGCVRPGVHRQALEGAVWRVDLQDLLQRVSKCKTKIKARFKD